MAMRPVFLSGYNGNLCRPTTVEFTYHNGCSAAQRKRSALSLEESFLKERPNRKLLEVSSFSKEELGVSLSAFNLMLTLKDDRRVSVECAYQAGKVFRLGGPYVDLLNGTSKEAKKDPRLKNSGALIGFSFEGDEFPLTPSTCFYNWIYIKALTQNQELANRLMDYDAFTDIVFNPEKSISCQAAACAYYVSLRKLGLLEEALKSPEDFIRIVYKQDFDSSLFKKVFETDSVKPVINTVNIKPLTSASDFDQAASVTHTPEKPFESSLKIKDKISHPKFGTGEVTEVELHDTSARITIAFPTGTKTLDEKWIFSKCKKL